MQCQSFSKVFNGERNFWKCPEVISDGKCPGKMSRGNVLYPILSVRDACVNRLNTQHLL